MPVVVRPAKEADFPAIARFDLTYPADRYLHIQRSGSPPEHTFTLSWQEHDSPDAIYANCTEEWFRGAHSRIDLFLAAEVDDRVAGLLMIVLPNWTNAAEITDLAVDRPLRGRGAGTALVEAAAAWARERSKRALWVEPPANDAPAIDFYLRRGFRISGFNDRLYSNDDDAPGQPTIYLYREP